MKVDKKINVELSRLLKSQKVEREYMGGYDQTAEDLMKRYDKNNSQFFTLILKQEPINREKFENTQFIITEYETYVPEVRREALKKMDEEHNQDYQWVHQLINRYYPEEKTDREEWFREFDNYMECLLQSFYPEAIESLLESWAMNKFAGSVEDFNEQEYQKIIKKHKKAFIAYRKSLFMPYYEKTYQLNYEAILPDPLERFNHSCYLKQFYFIKTENQLLVATGCACGSGTRYHHGLFGHYFALLAMEGRCIKSFITRINKSCRFQIIKKADHLILYGHDLVGNFRIDPKSSQKVLKPVEMHYG